MLTGIFNVKQRKGHCLHTAGYWRLRNSCCLAGQEKQKAFKYSLSFIIKVNYYFAKDILILSIVVVYRKSHGFYITPCKKL